MTNLSLLRFIFIVLVMASVQVSASTVKRTDMAEIADGAQLIFEGRVVGKRIQHQPSSRTIHTWVRFEILDLIKGQHDQPFVELSFLGGSTGELRVEVSDMEIPKMGEQGIYFVEDIDRPMVNPLYGWAQGHFLVQYDRNLKRQKITTLDGRQVFDLDARPVKATTQEISHGIARGVLTRPQSRQDAPLEPEQFKAIVRGMLK